MNRVARRRHMPRIFTSPPSNLDMDLGSDLAAVTETADRPLDTWQHIVLEKTSRIDTLVADGTNPLLGSWTWSASEVGLLVARQNGKTVTVEARELAGLYTLGERIVYTAATLAAARCSFDSLRSLIMRTPALAQQVEHVTISRGKESILMRNGAIIRYCARTPANLDTAIDADLLILDDAHHLPTAWTAAAVHGTPFRRPKSTRRQVWYVGSAVDEEHDEAYGETFTAVRERGLTGADPNLCWIEYSAPDRRDDDGNLLIDPSNRAVIARANPSLRIDPEKVAQQLEVLTPRTFEVNCLSIGYWPALASANA